MLQRGKRGKQAAAAAAGSTHAFIRCVYDVLSREFDPLCASAMGEGPVQAKPVVRLIDPAQDPEGLQQALITISHVRMAMADRGGSGERRAAAASGSTPLPTLSATPTPACRPCSMTACPNMWPPAGKSTSSTTPSSEAI